MIGGMLGHYRILDKIGEGGMGEVYAAEDTKLNRKVAIKILPGDVAGDSNRLSRFEREATAIAALNHPNIVTVYSIEEAEGIHFITMELVDGTALSESIPEQGFTLERFLEIAIPVTEAISAAHQQGITHRDLKPENLILGDDGRVRLLDFGLAKLRRESSEVAAPVKSMSLTEEGMIIGTVTHMSPEQALGRKVDERSDLFSLGIIFYEMISGSLPFQGESQISIISSILKDTPPEPRELSPNCPDGLSHIVMQCLEKDPAGRYQRASDLLRDLKGLSDDLETGALKGKSLTASASLLKALSPLRIAGAVLLAGILGVLASMVFSAVPPPVARLSSEQQITFASGKESAPTWHPAGTAIAYESNEDGDWDIYMRVLNEPQALNLTGDHEGIDRNPAWSPDAKWIAFYSDRPGGNIWLISRTGGDSRPVSTLSESPARMPGITWAPDSERLAFIVNNVLHIVSVDGETQEQHPLSTDASVNPAWSPDGRWIAWNAMTGGSSTQALWLVRPDGSAIKKITDGLHFDVQPQWSEKGKGIYFISDRSGPRDVWWVPVHRSGRAGRPHRIPAGRDISSFSVCREPLSVAFTESSRRGSIYSIPIVANRTLHLADATRHTFDDQRIEALAVSPDGQWIAFNSNRSGNEDIWKMALDGSGPLVPIIRGHYGATFPDWSPDGRIILFFAITSGDNRDLYVVSSDGGAAEALTTRVATDFFGRWSPDGTKIAFYSDHGGMHDIWLMSASGDSLERLMPPSELERIMPLWSPDGGKIAFRQYLSSGHSDISIYSFNTGESIRLTNTEWSQIWPFYWSPDGATIYSIASDGKGVAGRHIWSFSVQDGEGTLLLDLRGTQLEPVWSISSDGERLYFPLEEEVGDIWIKR